MRDEWQLAVVGNATLIFYRNSNPILVCDPWMDRDSTCYFGSWSLSHGIPERYLKDIFDCKYIWFSHGHPDHLNPHELHKLKGKTILLGDHRGSRIARDLTYQNHSISILPDRTWVEIDGLKLNCVTNYIQDSALLIDIGKTVVGNLNDSGGKTMSRYIREQVQRFENRLLTCLSGYGDADLINLYIDGKRLPTKAESQPDVIEEIKKDTVNLGFNYFIPSSTFHKFNRTDTYWVQNHSAPIEIYHYYQLGGIEIFPAFCLINLNSMEFDTINPEPNTQKPHEPEFFGDNYSDVLDKDDKKIIKKYFCKFEKVVNSFDYIEFNVGGLSNVIELHSRSARKTNKSVIFETPRESLMSAVQYGIFDDLLISNIPKVTLNGFNSLYDHGANFNYWVCKYGDNGLAYSRAEVSDYLSHYRRQAGSEFILDSFASWGKSILGRFVQSDSRLFKKIKKGYHCFKYR